MCGLSMTVQCGLPGYSTLQIFPHRKHNSWHFPAGVQKNICLMLARSYPFADFALDNHRHGGSNSTASHLYTFQLSLVWEGNLGDQRPKVEDPAEETRQLEYLKRFLRETRALKTSQEGFVQLENSCGIRCGFQLGGGSRRLKAISHSAEEWSRYVSSRVAARREEGELSETLNWANWLAYTGTFGPQHVARGNSFSIPALHFLAVLLRYCKW